MIKRPTQAAARAAFTLMEMLVVVAILVVLAGAAVPIYMSYLDSAKRDRAKADIHTLEKVIMAYEFDHTALQDNDWNTLMQPGDNARALLEQKSTMDPWNQQYHFSTSQRSAAGRPKVWSTGPPGGTAISNW